MKIKISIALIAIFTASLFIFQSCSQDNQNLTKTTKEELALLPETRGSGENICSEFIREIPNCPFSEGIYEFVHPDYPDCSLWVHYKFRQCPVLEIIYLGFGHYGDCPAIEQDIITYGSSIETKIANYALNQIIWNYGTEHAADCTYEENYVVKVYKSNCNTTIKHPRFGTEFTLACGVSCCSSSILFCKDPVTGEVTSEIKAQDQLFPCKDNTLQLPPGALIIKECQANCFDLVPVGGGGSTK
jgi:hypothetical protein